MTSVSSIADAIVDLATSFSGELLTPRDAGYEQARRVHNGLVNKRPALIARCRGVADVADAVRLARKLGLEVAVRGGGHNVAGRATIDGGLMIDLASMKARNSSFTYKGRAVRVQQVAQELGVAYVIEGSVRKAANRVRITAQLIDCATGGHLWADRYDRELTDIFAIQDEVTTEIVGAMALTLTSDEQRRLVRKGTSNLEAYDCLLRAREQWWRLTREGTKNAETILERAITLDPDFSTPYAWLSYVRVQEYINEWRNESEELLSVPRPGRKSGRVGPG